MLSKLTLAGAVFRSSREHGLLERAAQLSFYFLLGIFPFLIFVSAILGFVFGSGSNLYSRVLVVLSSTMPPPAFQLIEGTANDMTLGTSGGKVLFGLVLALWTGSAGMVAVMDGLNVAYKVREERRWVLRRLIGLLLTIAIGILALASTLMVLVGGKLQRLVLSVLGRPEQASPGLTVGGWIIAVISMLVALVVIYRFAPNVKGQSPKSVLPGALVALAGWFLLTTGFRIYLEFSSSLTRTYGSLAAVIALLFWLYLSAMTLLLGGEVNSAIRSQSVPTL